MPVTIAAVTGTEPHEAGLASGLINTSQQVGGALGLAILATVANSRTQSLFHAGVHSSAVALTKGFDRAFLVGAGFAVAGAILAAVLISSRDSHEHSKAARTGEAAGADAAAVPVARGLSASVDLVLVDAKRPRMGGRVVGRLRLEPPVGGRDGHDPAAGNPGLRQRTPSCSAMGSIDSSMRNCSASVGR